MGDLLRVFGGGVVPNPPVRDASNLTADSPQVRAFLRGDDIGDPLRIISASAAWRHQVWVRRGVSTIARNLARLPLQIFRLADTEAARPAPVKAHPVLEMVRKPNAYTSQFGLLFTTSCCLHLFGEAFWIIGRKVDVRATPQKALLLSPRAFHERLSPDKLDLLGWQVSMPNGSRVFVDRLDVLHFMIPDPFNPWRGASPLEAAQLAITGDIAMQEHNIGFFQRGASVDGVIETEKHIHTTRGREIIEQFENRHKKSHRTALLTDGMKFHETHSNHRDSEFEKGRDKNREEILGILGVPPTVVGIESANFATAREQRKGFWVDTVIPHGQLVTDGINAHFLEDEGLTSSFNTDGIEDLRDTLEQKLGSASKVWAMGVPFNTIDEKYRLGIGPVAGGERGFIPINLQPVDSVDDNLAADDPPDGSGTPQGGEPKPQEKKPNGDPAPATQKTIDWEAVRGHITAGLTKVVAPALAREALPERVVQAVLGVIRDDNDELKGLSLAYFKNALAIGGEQMADLLNSSFEISMPEASAFLSQKVMRISRISDTSQERVRQVILDWMQTGEGRSVLAQQLRELYSDFEGRRARGIARNELAQAVSGGRFIVLKKEGVKRHEWVNSEDERVRETHRLEVGHVVDVGDEFPVTHLVFPCDPEGDSSETVGCRCITLPAEEDARCLRLVIDKGAYWRNVTKQWAPLERRYARRLKKFFFDQRSRILTLLADADAEAA